MLLRLLALMPRRLTRMLKWVRYAAYAFGLFALLAWLVVPPVLKWAVETKGAAALGRRISVEAAGFDPFRLEGRLDGLRIAEADEREAWISIRHARANLSLSSLWHRALILDGVRLDEPRVRILRENDARYNFSDLIERFAAKPDAPPSAPLRFSISNIELHGGAITYDDRPMGVVHQVEALNLGLPFISNLPTSSAIQITPSLDARINGSNVHLKGELNPFGATREATLDVGFEALDLTHCLAYLKDALPVGLRKASVTSGLHLVWREGDAGRPASLALSGKLSFADVEIRDKTDAPLLGFDKLELDIERLEPLASPLVADFRHVTLNRPALNLHRFGDGRFNLAKLFAPQAPAAGRQVVESARNEVAVPAPRLRVQRLELAKGVLRWQDDAVPGGYAQTLDGIELALQRLDLASDAPAALSLRARGGQGERLVVEAALGLRTLRVGGSIQADGLHLETLSPYYQAAIGRARLAGEATLNGRFAADLSREASGMRLDGLALSLKDFGLYDRKAKEPLLALPEFGLEAASLDLAKQTVDLGKLRSAGGRVLLERGRGGRINLVEVLQDAAGAEGRRAIVKAGEALRAAPTELTPIHALPAAQPAQARPTTWTVALADGELSGWQLKLTDRSGQAPVVVDLAGLGLRLKDWSSRPGQEATLSLKGRVNQKGRLEATGRLVGSPFRTSLDLKLQAVDLIAAQPYVDELYKILITRGQVSASGRLSVDTAVAGTPDLRFAGAIAIDNFNALDRLNETDFMRWKRFGATGLKFQTRPLTFLSSELRLDDFFSRLILDEQGRLNVRELRAGDAGSADSPLPTKTGEARVELPPPASSPVFSVGRVLLRDGSVIYTDLLVKPNYEARLLALNGELKDLSSDPDKIATLSLKASLDGAAPVNVDGRLNPFRQDRMLDIQAQVRDVDLTTASTYAARYAGYGIEKGKLSMDVQYQVQDRQLSARNSLHLDQLSFGERVASQQATSLPVLIVVSLLKDRHGVIDLNLPISGSLDDPQFSLGSVILKVITNLFSKAVSSPFALLGSVFGENPEALSFVAFDAGSARIGEQERQKLGSLAKALGDRPALRLEIAGRADPAADATALKHERLLRGMRSLKAEQLVRRGEEAGELSALQITQEEYPVLLKKVYEQTRIDARPRNALGMLRTLPVEDMERLLLGNYVISAEDLQGLATARAQVVRGFLLEEGGVASSRIFMRRGDEIEAEDGESPQPGVEFVLH